MNSPPGRTTTGLNKAFILVLSGLILASGAQSQTSASFDTLNDGDLLTTQIPGITFSNATVLTSGFSLNQLDFPAHSGQNVVSDSGGPITLTFASAINSFSAYFTHAGSLTIAPFGADGTALAATTSTKTNTLATGDPGSTPNEQLTASSASGIAKIIITGAPAGRSFSMDDLTTAVTPPAGGGGGGGPVIPPQPPANTFSAMPASLIFNQTVNAPAPANQKFLITATPSNISFSAAVSDPWLTIVQQNGFSGSNVIIHAEGTGLGVGAYSGSVTFTNSVQAINNPFTVPVTLYVHPPVLSKFTASPTSLTFDQVTPGPAPGEQQISIGATPNPIAYTLTPSDSWIQIHQKSGTTGNALSIGANGGSMKPGTYTGSLTFNDPVYASNDGFTVPVTLNFHPPGGSISGIVGAGSFTSAVAAGGIGAIFGAGLGSSPLSATSIPLPFTLGQTSVTVNGEPAALYYVGPTQINFEFPTDLAPGTFPAVVTVNGNPSLPFNVTLAPAAPGIFLIPGSTQAAALNIPSGSVNGSTAGAIPGSYISMFLTGGGAVDQAVSTGAASPSAPLANFAAAVTATIGGQPAPVTFAGLTPGLVALGQVNLQIPNLAPGQYPVVISFGSVVSNTATIYIGNPQ